MIRVTNLGFGWPGRRPLFSGLDLTLPAGGVVALGGANGSGKSSFLRLLAGLERPQSGRIEIGGIHTASAAPADLARRVGAVLQSPDRHFLRPTVIEEVALGPALLGLPDPESLAHAALRRLGLDPFAGAHPLDLDAGKRRLASLATAIVHAPQLLLLDEVQRGLDRVNRAVLERVIAAEAGRGAAVLLVSHDAEFRRRTASRTIRFPLAAPGDP